MKIEIGILLCRKIYYFYKRLAPLKKMKEDEGIVNAFGNKRRETAMSAHHILGLEKVPRVGLFAR